MDGARQRVAGSRLGWGVCSVRQNQGHSRGTEEIWLSSALQNLFRVTRSKLESTLGLLNKALGQWLSNVFDQDA